MSTSTGEALRVQRVKLLHVCIAGGCLGILSWLLLRQPELRNFLVESTPHRIRVQATVNREMLAPRSMFFAGALLFIGTACLFALPATRRSLLAAIDMKSAATALFVLVQFTLAAAVAINLNLWVNREFGAPIGAVRSSAIMKHTLPYVWEELLCLRRNVKPDARIAVSSKDEFNTNLLGPLAYPLALYDFRFRKGSIDEEAGTLGMTVVAEYLEPGRIDDRLVRPGGIRCHNLYLRPLQ